MFNNLKKVRNYGIQSNLIDYIFFCFSLACFVCGCSNLQKASQSCFIRYFLSSSNLR
ncbi:hypothetical protein C2G38_2054864 [Gigaspora rosea]|uniref:Lipoprotein n=1 Tax=Gigaspora rosea TaxID=44941 RepID=A0A397WCZ5_9GLOM|nr:hypothetical protein C2G38_2054864 [Gigaspora rosea]